MRTEQESKTSPSQFLKTDGAATKRYRYMDLEWDEETGSDYHRVRHYLPRLRRILRADPVGIGDGS